MDGGNEIVGYAGARSGVPAARWLRLDPLPPPVKSMVSVGRPSPETPVVATPSPPAPWPVLRPRGGYEQHVANGRVYE